jgi:hypothetical protein
MKTTSISYSEPLLISLAIGRLLPVLRPLQRLRTFGSSASMEDGFRVAPPLGLNLGRSMASSPPEGTLNRYPTAAPREERPSEKAR